MAEKVAIVGSRGWVDKDAVIDYIWRLEPDSLVVSGGAKGVDSFAEEGVRIRWMHRHDVRLLELLPEWDKYGKSAGFRRNAEIVAEADRVVAFWDGASKGTASTIRLARKAGKPVEVYYADGRVEGA